MRSPCSFTFLFKYFVFPLYLLILWNSWYVVCTVWVGNMFHHLSRVSYLSDSLCLLHFVLSQVWFDFWRAYSWCWWHSGWYRRKWPNLLFFNNQRCWFSRQGTCCQWVYQKGSGRHSAGMAMVVCWSMIYFWISFLSFLVLERLEDMNITLENITIGSKKNDNSYAV